MKPNKAVQFPILLNLNYMDKKYNDAPQKTNQSVSKLPTIKEFSEFKGLIPLAVMCWAPPGVAPHIVGSSITCPMCKDLPDPPYFAY